ncbi:MAG: tRNA epoxyqueuosine(34) reductase QueG [Oligoflexia bacterium]|nr:tRNA epoxyqueuosine(34) reductase QueG [Oligoflexia bacterium]
MNEQNIKNLVLQHFDLVGITSVIKPPSIDIYENWLKNSEHGSMQYLHRHFDKKKNPELLLKGASSWVVAALYYDNPEPLSIDIMEELKANGLGWISRYARLNDYHKVIEEKLNKIISELSKIFPDEKFLGCVDIKAVLERDTAERAGIGWIGKNTCVINQNLGSFIFLAEILTTMKLAQDKPALDHCGTCSRCIDVCPTGAIVEPKHVDARLCISYWTIENDKLPPEELSWNFKQNLFGCDLCQDVCPWNKKARRVRFGFGQAAEAFEKSGLVGREDVAVFNVSLKGGSGEILYKHDSNKIQGDNLKKSFSYFDLRELIDIPVEVLKEKIAGTAMERAGAEHLKQTAKVLLERV